MSSPKAKRASLLPSTKASKNTRLLTSGIQAQVEAVVELVDADASAHTEVAFRASVGGSDDQAATGAV